jgi:hypothetical protein
MTEWRTALRSELSGFNPAQYSVRSALYAVLNSVPHPVWTWLRYALLPPVR